MDPRAPGTNGRATRVSHRGQGNTGYAARVSYRIPGSTGRATRVSRRAQGAGHRAPGAGTYHPEACRPATRSPGIRGGRALRLDTRTLGSGIRRPGSAGDAGLCFLESVGDAGARLTDS